MEIIDYAQHLIKIENYSKVLHNLALDKKYIEAIELIPPLQAEIRLLSATLAIMQNDTIR